MLNSVIILRIWQAAAGFITTLLVVHFLSLEEQGWYYSFLSVAALYTLLDLGLSTVLVQVAAKTSVGLRWGDGYSCSGPDASRLIALLSKSLLWYFVLAGLFIIIVYPIGLAFFGRRDMPDVIWQWPWLLLCTVTALNLLFLPILSILEGAGKLQEIYSLRLTQAILGASLCWCMLASGAGLWTASMISLVAVIVGCIWIFQHCRGLLVAIWTRQNASYDWYKNIWPLQWRLAVGSVCGYLITQINIPILFYLKSPELAGQFGLSFAVVNTLNLVCQSWFARHVPLMTQAVIRRDWVLLDQIFYKDFKQSLIFFVMASILILTAYFYFADTKIVNRLLNIESFVGLFTFSFTNLCITAFATQLRSFCREPFLRLVVINTIIILPSVLLATYFYSISGMIFVLNFVYILIFFPISYVIWRRLNFNWRN